MPSSQYYLGIDGGATKTEAVLCDEQLNVLCRGISGPSNYYIQSLREVLDHIKEATQFALEPNAVTEDQLQGIGIGLAGLSDGDHDELRSNLPSIFSFDPASISITHDVATAHAGAFNGGPGILTILGTGSSCQGIDDQGKIIRVGGWGHLVDDVGSGYDLGRRLLMIAVRMLDGRLERTQLADTVLDLLEVKGPRDIISKINGADFGKSGIAGLATILLDLANAGDAYALFQIQEATRETALLILSAIEQYSGNPVPVSIVGGMTQFREYLEAIIHVVDQATAGNEHCDLQWKDPLHPPAVGAASLGMNRAQQ